MKQVVPTYPRLESELRQWIRTHHGVISRSEAFRLGATTDVIRAKVDNGDWARMHTSVYRATAVPPTPYQDLRAAWVATRVGVVSHGSAAWVWGLVPAAPARPELSVRAGTGQARRPQGVTIHRCTDLDVTQAVLHKEILLTNPLRTLVDLAGSATSMVLTNAVDTAVATKLVSISALTAEISRLSRHGRRGVGVLRRNLADRGYIGAPAPSVLEARAHRLVASTRLPLPSVEVKVGEEGEYRLDLAWLAILLTIEFDGYLWHFSPEHQRRDLNRRNRIQAAGWTLRVYTWRDVCDEPARVAREIVAVYEKLQAFKTRGAQVID